MQSEQGRAANEIKERREHTKDIFDCKIDELAEKDVTLQTKYDERGYTEIKRHGRTD